MSNKLTIQEIVDSCGGAMALAHRFKLNYNTILYWKRIGAIPKAYWEPIRKLTSLKSLSIEDLFYAK